MSQSDFGKAMDARLSSDEIDAVNHPPHYNQHDMECIDVLRVLLTEDEFRGFCLGNMLKYRWRAGDKGDAGEDMAKSKWYEGRVK